VLNLTGNGALDVLIGLAFFYFILSVICSAVNEAIATLMNYRAKDLEKGIANLLGGKENATLFYLEPRLQQLAKGARVRDGIKGLKHLFANSRPSYIPPRVFALTMLDMFAPPKPAPAQPAPPNIESADLAVRTKTALDAPKPPPSTASPAGATPPPQPIFNSIVETLLQDALNEAGTDVAKLRTALENAFNEMMDRVSGWYKRRVQLILFIVALAVVGLANADSYRIGKTLWQNDAVRGAVVQEAQSLVKSGNSSTPPACAASGTDEQKVANCVAEVKQLGLPLGWTEATTPSGWGIAGTIGGLLVSAFAVLLGAPFWFDTLSKLAQLRGAGKSPDDKDSSTASAAAKA
jgi:hypothetical protein